MRSLYYFFLAIVVISPQAIAELHLHPIFDNNMVLQRDAVVKVWGSANAGAEVVVAFGDQVRRAQSSAGGQWAVALDAMPASGQGRSLKITSGADAIELKNVLVGDVWLCGGQSNMELSLERIFHSDVEIPSAQYPQIRLMTIPAGASPTVLSDFERLDEFNSWTSQHELKGMWLECTPENVKLYAGIGYVFGRRLHQATGVPIGLVDNSVGGTTVEGWTSRQTLATIPEAAGLLADWDERIASWDAEADLANRIARWEQDTQRRKERGEKPTPKPDDLRPGPAFDRNNPGASYNAMLASFAGFRLRGIIFHQGYNNALADARPNLYAKTIQAMISDWRNAFDDERLPFGIIELSAGAEPQTMDDFELRMIDAGPYIREAQFRAYRELENIGWAAAYDQQVNWYHPQMKTELAERMARWALATQYGMPIGHQPAIVVGTSIDGGQMTIAFDREVTVVDGRPISGMAIAGQDQRFYPAKAEFAVKGQDERGRETLDFTKVVVSSPFVADPKSVRYAWARCPLGNLTNRSHYEKILPVPSFRTDDWLYPDAPFGDDNGETRRRINEARRTATEQAKDRRLREAERIIQETAEPRVSR